MFRRFEQATEACCMADESVGPASCDMAVELHHNVVLMDFCRSLRFKLTPFLDSRAKPFE